MRAAQIDPALSALAARSGLLERWQDVHGHEHRVPVAVLQALLEALDLPCRTPAQIGESNARLDHAVDPRSGAPVIVDAGMAPDFEHQGPLRYQVSLEHGGQYSGAAIRTGAGRACIDAVEEPGYHTLEIGGARRPLIVAPMRCPSVAQLTGRGAPRLWGVTAQVYGLRRATDDVGGRAPQLTEAGDYAALAEFVHAAGEAGADAVGISPVHAMFSADSKRYSPYAPSSRLFLNAGYVDPRLVLGADAVRTAMGVLATGAPISRGDPKLIDWGVVLDGRLLLCRYLFERFETQAPASLVSAFQAFRKRGGEALENHGRYEALHGHFAATLGASCGWREWPAKLHDPRGHAVRHYAKKFAQDVSFHIFLQWLADEGMRLAQDRAVQAGMAVGLITDLAIGTDARGSHAWSHQGDILDKVSVGAPPDLYQSQGQDWGLTAFSPRSLREQAFAPFIATLRAALAHAGGVRIDHILGLERMWLIPQGAAASEGAYVRYPRDDMLRVLALEAWRHQALIIGENLGTVPDGFNERIYDKGVLGTSVLWFERETADAQGTAAFTSSRTWSAHAVASPTTHDLPTIMGWWLARDLVWRDTQEQLDPDELALLRLIRERDKGALCRALKEAGEGELDPLTASPQALRIAILSFIASAPTPLVLIPIEDLLGELEQPNLPGAQRSGSPPHPNWLRRQAQASRPIFASEEVRACIAAIEGARKSA